MKIKEDEENRRRVGTTIHSTSSCWRLRRSSRAYPTPSWLRLATAGSCSSTPSPSSCSATPVRISFGQPVADPVARAAASSATPAIMRAVFRHRASPAVLDRGLWAAARRLRVRRRDELGDRRDHARAAAARDRPRHLRAARRRSARCGRSRRWGSARSPGADPAVLAGRGGRAAPDHAARRRRRGAPGAAVVPLASYGPSTRGVPALADRDRRRAARLPERELADEEMSLVRAVANTLATALARLRNEERMRHDAVHDPLTGLANRTLLRDRLEQALARSGARGRRDRGAVRRPRQLQAGQRRLRPRHRGHGPGRARAAPARRRAPGRHRRPAGRR